MPAAAPCRQLRALRACRITNVFPWSENPGTAIGPRAPTVKVHALVPMHLPNASHACFITINSTDWLRKQACGDLYRLNQSFLPFSRVKMLLQLYTVTPWVCLVHVFLCSMLRARSRCCKGPCSNLLQPPKLVTGKHHRGWQLHVALKIARTACQLHASVSARHCGCGSCGSTTCLAAARKCNSHSCCVLQTIIPIIFLAM